MSVPGGNGLPPGQAMGDGSFSALMAEATRYIGYPYVWGGSSPDTSSTAVDISVGSTRDPGVSPFPNNSSGDL